VIEPIILTDPTQDYPSIRRAIDVTLDEEAIPNDALEDPFVIPRAEQEVVGWFPAAGLFALLSEADKQAVRSATILLAAANLAPRVPMLTAESFGDHRYTRTQEQLSDMVQRLRGEAWTAIQKLADPDNTAGAVHGGRRFRLARSGYPRVCS
jgi:hypothetical protein